MADPVVTVQGNMVGGWIVEVHDGDRYLCHPVKADSEADAAAVALDAFKVANP